ncbi:Gfo/Idh/MocA family protein [Poseidonocella sedimentorum]|uniref:Predicted dehydrogenase n=1 Tax=Poseidonocella sedimentorum TaxID=871652 RepID=A0A1I6DYK9_9RHOB|nr:Gfo/Idh/MocA family oxidoreductase [Poseidonocella sedimentorum]SFR10503.1 Predicted dehydrogenase [Poseidonocella sedimentorum]
MTDYIRWGILGAANFALRHMGQALHAAPHGALEALATGSPEKAAAFHARFPGLRIHDSYEALLADPEIDAIYIPLPNTLHVDWALKALDAGKHVLVEKPLAMSAGAFDAVIAKRDETGLMAAEAYMIVHHPQWQHAKALYEAGRIGKLISVRAVFSYDNSDDAGNIRLNPDLGGGGIPDIGVYTYGCTRFVTGEEPEEITYVDIDWENGVDVYAEICARFPSFRYHAINSMRMFPAQEMQFHGSEGLIKLTAPFNARVFGEARVELHKDGFETEITRFTADNHYEIQVEAFNTAALHGGDYACPLEFSKGTQAMIDAVFAAAKREKADG